MIALKPDDFLTFGNTRGGGGQTVWIGPPDKTGFFGACLVLEQNDVDALREALQWLIDEGCLIAPRPADDDASARMNRWLASSRFSTPDNIPPPEIQDYMEQRWAAAKQRAAK